MQLVHVAAWHAIPSTPGAQFQLHLSEFSTVSGWCRSVHSVAVVDSMVKILEAYIGNPDS